MVKKRKNQPEDSIYQYKYAVDNTKIGKDKFTNAKIKVSTDENENKDDDDNQENDSNNNRRKLSNDNNKRKLKRLCLTLSNH